MLTLVDMKKYLILAGTLLIAATACNKDKKAMDKPQISITSIAPNTVKNGSPADTVIISFKYAMAASAVGTASQPTKLILNDNRDTALILTEPFPEDMYTNLPDGEINIEGTLTMKLPAINYLVLRPDRPDGDTLKYTIYLSDKDGIQSNRVVSDNIYIVP